MFECIPLTVLNMVFPPRVRRWLPSRHLVITFSVMNMLLVMLHVKMDEIHNLHPKENSTERYVNVTESTHTMTSLSIADNVTAAPEGFTTTLGDQEVDQYGETVFMIEPKCSPDSIFIMVYSKPSRVQQRDLIRDTWGNTERYEGAIEYNLQLIFVLGSDKLDKSLQREAEANKDLLVADFDDVESNQILKGQSTFQWISGSCGIDAVVFVLKIEDDLFVNLYEVTTRITVMLEVEDRHFLCALAVKHRSDLPGSEYPTHCDSKLYGMAKDTLKFLIKACSDARPALIENYYFTSYCLQRHQPNLGLKYKRLARTQLDASEPLTTEKLEELSDLPIVHPLPGEYWHQLMLIVHR